jgi:hypothetical protein
MSRRGRFGNANVLLEPLIYRIVIDDVLAAMRPEFQDHGVSEEVLADLMVVSQVLESLSYVFPDINPLARHLEMAG